jgi:tripartite-type tricarboxylate transporter receptor subunit TctC
VAYTWNAIFLPAKAPAEVVKTLNAAAGEAMKSPAVSSKLSALGANIATPAQMTPDYLAGLVKSEIEKWAAPIKASGAIIN